MKDEVHRLSELIQSFLNYGRPIEVHPAPTDVRALVGNVLELSDSKLRSQSFQALQQGAEAPVILNVDAEKLHACFINVVANAIQAMPEGGELNIAFKRDGDNEVITFSDTGAGIDPEVASHVFEPFFTTKREGIGLGLFFSRAIVERHGGTIRIGANQAGRGTMVTFILPLGAPGRRT
jgi:signal transduction histidine kinase